MLTQIENSKLGQKYLNDFHTHTEDCWLDNSKTSKDDERLMDNGFGFTHDITMRDIPENHKDIVLSVVRCPFDRVWSMYNFYGFTRKAFS